MRQSISLFIAKLAENICYISFYCGHGPSEESLLQGKPGLLSPRGSQFMTGQQRLLIEKNLATLATISGAAPMIGFLGTVIGMILASHQMASAGGKNIIKRRRAKGRKNLTVSTGSK